MVFLIREYLNVSSIFRDHSVLGTLSLPNEIQYVKPPRTAAANCRLSTGRGDHRGIAATKPPWLWSALLTLLRRWGAASPSTSSWFQCRFQFTREGWSFCKPTASSQHGSGWTTPGSSPLRASYHWLQMEVSWASLERHWKCQFRTWSWSCWFLGGKSWWCHVWDYDLAPQIMSGSGLFHQHCFTSVDIEGSVSRVTRKHPSC